MEKTELIKPIKLYVRDFALWYIGLAILIAIISSYIDLGAGARFLTAFVAASFVVGRFLKREGRAPTDPERNALTTGSMIVWLVFNIIVGIVLFVSMNILGEVPEVTGLLMFILVLFLLILASLTYFVLHLSYGWLARKQAKALAAKR